MHILLYFIAVSFVIAGSIYGANYGNIVIISWAVTIAILFGYLGRVVHLLGRIDEHLGKLTGAPEGVLSMFSRTAKPTSDTPSV